MEKNYNPQEWFEIGKQYLDLGWSIIPIGSNKKPLCPWKNYQNQQVTLGQLELWCKNPALTGFAIVTGRFSNVFVIDVDNGSEFEIQSLPQTPHSKTGSGGHHLFFTYPDNENLHNSGGFQPHTDTRGEGGYAVLPPSKHPNGIAYEWLVNPFSNSLAQVPDWLIDELKKPTGKTKVSSDSENIFDGVEESKRNDSATRVIGKILHQFKQEDWDTEGWPLVQGWNLKNKPPLEESELLTTFNSIKEKALRESVPNGNKVGNNTAGQIVSLVFQSGLEVFPNQFKQPCITSPECNFIAYPLKSKRTDQLLFKMYWDKFKKAPGTKAVTEAKSILEGTALFDKVPTKTLHNRIGEYNDDIYYDIGDNEHVIHISSNGWNIKTACPLLFQRFSHQKVQVLPVRDGNLKDLLGLVNVTRSENQLLLLVILVISFLPNIPRPILALNGAPGSSKSTLLKFLREFIDPSEVSLITPPNTVAELAQLANHNYAVYFDNLSNVPTWLSDCICRLVTGDGYSKRELYTDDDDVLYAHKRAVGICGVNQVATKPDLLDRCVIIALDLIDETKRREESELWRAFYEAKPFVLGAVFDCLSYIKRTAPTLTIKSRPRLADSFRYALAVAKFLGFSERELVQAYTANTRSQHEEAIEGSSVAQVVIEFMSDKKDPWYGTSTQLHGELKDIAEKLKVGFPKTPNWVWREINEVKHNLMAAGILAEKIRESKANKIRLTKTKDTANDELRELLGEEPSGTMEAVEAEIDV